MFTSSFIHLLFSIVSRVLLPGYVLYTKHKIMKKEFFKIVSRIFSSKVELRSSEKDESFRNLDTIRFNSFISAP
ncbi:MAG: hypothetical protein K0S32_2582 [Bacteroidetes bacterium]|jgi:hypothetical protein|nr:hypothetical protein [Bacteroidota bacterium]